MSPMGLRRLALAIGWGVGLGLGLVYTWVLHPIELVDTRPRQLYGEYRQDWVRMAVLSYAADGNSERAAARLRGIDHDDVAKVLRAVIEEYAAAGRPAETLRRLSALAASRDVYTPAMGVYLPTSTPLPTATATATPTATPTDTPTPTPTPTSTPTSTPTPTRTPSPTPTATPRSMLIPTFTPTPPKPSATPSPTATVPIGPVYQVAQKEWLCEPGRASQIEVVVQDEAGQGVAGVDVWLLWNGGADRTVTGLKPGMGAGYVDFAAQPGTSYQLSMGELELPLVTNLLVSTCQAEQPFMGSWRVVIVRQMAEIGSD